MATHIIDLHHDGLEGAIGAVLVDGPEPVLVDCGPATSLDALEEGMRALGLPLARVPHLALTHVHLDHAGGAGHLAARYPHLTVHAHVDAAPHLVDPTRLVASTRRTFGDAHDRLWGEVRPLPAHRLRVWRPGERGPLSELRALPTPGHLPHHLSFVDEREGTLVAGDALGIVLDPELDVHPATPPPGIDLTAWSRSLETLESVGAERVAVAHFGLHDDPADRIAQLREALTALAARVAEALAEDRADEDARVWEEEVRERHARVLPRERVDRYFDVFRAATDYAGVRRFVESDPSALGRLAGG